MRSTITSLFLFGGLFMLLALTRVSAQEPPTSKVVEVVMRKDSMLQQVVSDPEMYYERWDTLAQPRFWRRVMNLTPDSAVLNIAADRSILEIFPTERYDTLDTEGKRAFKRQKLAQYHLPSHTRIYVTYGKADYYQIRAVMPSIGKAIEIFEEVGTDPWYAQAILLIESPGQIRRSPTGAYGSFQLMSAVAREEGLLVDSRVDERENFAKSAAAAARFLRRVCIPEARRIAKRHGLDHDEQDLWFRLMVLHCYHAGAGNVAGAVRKVNPQAGGMALITALWHTEHRGFRNASQNYSQVALASLLELDALVSRECDVICRTEE
jgi:hypothetical protein